MTTDSSGAAVSDTRLLTDRLPEAPTAALEIDALTVVEPLMVGSEPPADPRVPVSVTVFELVLVMAIVLVVRFVLGMLPDASTMLFEENEAEEPTAATEMLLPVPPAIEPPRAEPVTATAPVLVAPIVVAPKV